MKPSPCLSMGFDDTPTGFLGADGVGCTGTERETGDTDLGLRLYLVFPGLVGAGCGKDTFFCTGTVELLVSVWAAQIRRVSAPTWVLWVKFA
jgi:hypothetical protein